MTNKVLSQFFQRAAVRLLPAVILLLITACSFRPQVAALGAGEPNFLPPTLVPKITPSPILPTAAATEPLDCYNSLSWQKDLTIPDGSEVAASSTLDKQWEVLNSGTCNWEEGYELRLISGDAMGAATVQALPPSRSGILVTIRVMFTAPAAAGSYRSAWKAYSPTGDPFGDEVYIEIVVK